MLRGVCSFVWQDLPGRLEPGVSTWLIKAANGNSTLGGGHDYARSYAAWADRVGPARTHAWTWLYDTTSGAHAADVLVAAAPKAAGYGMDVEGDDQGVNPATDLARLAPVVRAFCARIRELRPDADLWFTSYPDREQAMAHGAPWDDMVAGCDYGVPQVYYASQGTRWQQIVADHDGKPVVAAFSPGDWTTGWASLAQAAMRQHGAIAVWRYPDTRRYTDQLAALAALNPIPEDDMPLTDADAAKVADQVVAKLLAAPVDDATKTGGDKIPFRQQVFNAALHAARADAVTGQLRQLADPTKVADATVSALKAAGVGAAIDEATLARAFVVALEQLAGQQPPAAAGS